MRMKHVKQRPENDSSIPARKKVQNLGEKGYYADAGAYSLSALFRVLLASSAHSCFC